MAYPTPIVEIAFDHGPYELNPTWTPVTQWCWSMTIDRGRSDDWGDFDGSASVTLNNRDRRFDPYNTSGPYYGRLLPRRQIRIRAQTTTGGTTTTHDVFRGFIDGWAPQWTDAGTNSSVTLSCFDAFQLLAAEQLPADWASGYILGTSPRHYYPCNEPISPYSTTTTLTDLGSYPQNLTTTAIATSGSQLAVGLVNSSVQGTGGIAASSAYGVILGASSFTISMWAVLDADTSNCYGEIGNCSWTVGFQSATSKYTVLIDDYANSGLYRQFTTTTTFDGGAARMISFSFNVSSKAFALYLDGVAVATTVITGGSFYIPIGEQTNIGGGQIQQLIIWTSVVSQAVIQEIWKYSTVNLPETTAARFTRLIAQTQFPSALAPAPTGTVNSVLDITDDAPFVTPELRLVAASEGGPIFVSKAGVITMFNQNQQFTQTKSVTSQVTYGDGGTDMGQEVGLTPDGDSMRNAVNVSMSGGGVWTQENSTSVNAYGNASMTQDTQVQTLANAQGLGTLITGFGGNIYPRLTPVDVVLDADNDWTPTMALELCERITVKVKPPTGNTVTVPMLVQNIHHEYVPGYWKTTLEGSARWAAVWIWGTSTWDGPDLLG